MEYILWRDGRMAHPFDGIGREAHPS